MFVKAITTPPNNNGTVSPSQFFLPSVSIFTASGSDYNCVSAPNAIPIATLNAANFDGENYFYIAATNFYRTLADDDSLRLSAGTYSTETIYSFTKQIKDVILDTYLLRNTPNQQPAARTLRVMDCSMWATGIEEISQSGDILSIYYDLLGNRIEKRSNELII